MLLGSGLEVIAFQRTRPLFKLLTAEIQTIMDKTAASGEKLTKALLDESKVGLIMMQASGFDNIAMVVDESPINAYTSILTINQNHVFFDKFRRLFSGNADAYNLFRQTNNVLTGQIDLETGKVSGDFSKIPLVIGIGWGFFIPKYGFTAEEIAAILLHELGHDFTYCYALHYTCMTNMVLAHAVKAVVAAGDVRQKHAIMTDIENTLGIKIDNKDELTNYDKYENYYITMLTKYRSKVYDALGSSSYNANMAEQMADMFAARHGAGASIVTGLHKANKLAAEYGKVGRLYDKLEKIMTFIIFAPLTIPMAIACFMLNDFIAGTYDMDKDRFIRVRNEAYASLKDTRLSAEEKKRTLAEIEKMNEIIAATDYEWTLGSKLAVLVRAGQRNQMRQKRLQQDLEALTNNPLYASAAQYSL